MDEIIRGRRDQEARGMGGTQKERPEKILKLIGRVMSKGTKDDTNITS